MFLTHCCSTCAYQNKLDQIGPRIRAICPLCNEMRTCNVLEFNALIMTCRGCGHPYPCDTAYGDPEANLCPDCGAVPALGG